MPVDLNRVEAYRPAEAAVKEGRHLLQPTTATLKRAKVRRRALEMAGLWRSPRLMQISGFCARLCGSQKYEDLSHYYEVPDVGERTGRRARTTKQS